MAKVIPFDQGTGARPRSAGVIYSFSRRGEYIVSKWPRKRGPTTNRTQLFLARQFGLASKMASVPLDIDYQTAVNITKGYTNPPRDVLTAAAYGRLYDLQSEDGTIWSYHSHLPDPIEKLEFQEEDMAWTYSTIAGFSSTTTTSNTAANTKGNLFNLPIDVRIAGVRARLNPVAGHTYTCTVALLSAGYAITSILQQTSITPAAGGDGIFQWAMDVSVTGGQMHAILLHDTAGVANNVLPMFYVANCRGTEPYITIGNCYKAKASPAVGDVMTVQTGTQFSMGYLR